jgi:hypothetical protein
LLSICLRNHRCSTMRERPFGALICPVLSLFLTAYRFPTPLAKGPLPGASGRLRAPVSQDAVATSRKDHRLPRSRPADRHAVEHKGRVERSLASDVGADPQPIGLNTSITCISRPALKIGEAGKERRSRLAARLNHAQVVTSMLCLIWRGSGACRCFFL